MFIFFMITEDNKMYMCIHFLILVLVENHSYNLLSMLILNSLKCKRV